MNILTSSYISHQLPCLKILRMWRKGWATMGFTCLEKNTTSHQAQEEPMQQLLTSTWSVACPFQYFDLLTPDILSHLPDTWYLHVMYCSCWIRKNTYGSPCKVYHFNEKKKDQVRKQFSKECVKSQQASVETHPGQWHFLTDLVIYN